MTSTPDPTLDRLRTAYRELPHDHMRDLPTLLDHARARYRARRRTRAALTGIVGVAGVAGLVTTVTQFGADVDDPGPSTVASSAANPETPTTGGMAVPSDIAAAVDQLYPQLDAIPSLGYYMVESHDDRVVLWGDLELDEPGLVAAAQQVTDRTGVPVDVRPLEQAPSATEEQQNRLTSAATAIKQIMRVHPEVGYSTLRIQAPFDQLILWRTTPDADVDRAVEEVARDAGIVPELRAADYSQPEARGVIRGLVDRNDEWTPQGFEVLGGASRPTGVIINVDGNVAAAQRELLDEPGVLAISQDSEVTLPLTLE
jgi:hypothetical protein